MRGFIRLLSFAVAVFAAYTVWVDPQLGPEVRALLPDDVLEFPVIASITPSPNADGSFGGIGAANSVAGAVVSRASN